jgi:hypothetical protein
MRRGSSTVTNHSLHNPKVHGLRTTYATDTVEEKMTKIKFVILQNCLESTELLNYRITEVLKYYSYKSSFNITRVGSPPIQQVKEECL